MEKTLLLTDPLLESLEGTIQFLQDIRIHFMDEAAFAGNHDETINKSLIELAREAGRFRKQDLHLQRRGKATAQSVLDTLNLGFQQLAHSQNHITHVMATSAREDSVAIRAITLVTSLYLPFSFVAVRLSWLGIVVLS